ncbi:hypothetical protein D918_03703 [Trichuris suis]|nr:hypothetical protein D918_03703 [Trichuris suis]
MAALFSGFVSSSPHLYVTVELSVSCRNLPNTDVFSKSDPMCVMFKKAEQGDWQEAGRSEVVRNNLNPDFVHKFTIDYEFEARQPLKYDVDSASAKLEKHDFLGRVECTLAELVSEPRFESVLLDGPGRVPATIGMHRWASIVAEEQMESKEEVSFNIRAENLDNKRFLCKSNPQLAIYRVNEDTSWTIVYRTEVARRCLNPVWQPFSIGTSQLCCSDHYRTLRFRCIDWHGSGSETLIGEFETNLVDLIAASENGMAHFELINGRKKRKKATYENSGKIIIKTSITVVDSFLDYVKAGTHLSCAFAIDFTASNGDPRKPQSLHYFHPYLLNPYQMAIRAVGDVVKDYDSDKLFPVLGFGARLPPDGRVSHDFNVHPDNFYSKNGNSTNPFCTGIEGVLQAYGACLQSVQLAGPTNFAPVISHVARLASAHMDGSKYFILLIITDGVISDMPKTQEAIVDASTLPLSLIIVGVGEGDFTEMRILDGDQVRLSSKGKTAERDIVQAMEFVSMRDFAENMTAQSSELTAARLSREVLAEIPFQFLSFMKSKGITPDDVRKMNRCHKASQHVSNASASKGLNTALEAPPPYETSLCLQGPRSGHYPQELLCIKAIGHTTLRLLTHRAPVTLKCLQSRDWLRCKRLAHDGSKEESKASTSLDKSPKQSDQQESLIMKVLMEEDKAPKTRIEKGLKVLVAQAGKDLSYLTIIIVCVAVTGTIAYTVIHELFSSNRPNAIHSKTLKLLLANEQIVDILGLPIKSKGETNRGGRSRHVRHFEFERNDRQFMRMVFHVTGSRKKGTVQLELEKLQDNAGKYQYRYVLFQSNDHPKETVVLVDKRDELPLGPHSADNFKNKSTA